MPAPARSSTCSTPKFADAGAHHEVQALHDYDAARARLERAIGEDDDSKARAIKTVICR